MTINDILGAVLSLFTAMGLVSHRCFRPSTVFAYLLDSHLWVKVALARLLIFRWTRKVSLTLPMGLSSAILLASFEFIGLLSLVLSIGSGALGTLNPISG